MRINPIWVSFNALKEKEPEPEPVEEEVAVVEDLLEVGGIAKECTMLHHLINNNLFSKALASAKDAKADAKFLAVAPRDQNVGPGNSVATALLVARAGFTFTFILILNYCYSYPLFFTLHSLIN